jgi:hypothetical protein
MKSLKVKWSKYRQRLFEENPGDHETSPWLGGIIPVALLIVAAAALTFMVDRELGLYVLGGALFFYQHAGGRQQAELLARIEQLEGELKAARLSANQAPQRG